MAAPSQIPGHPQAAAVDSDGEAFPSGAKFFLDNVCSGFQCALAFDTGKYNGALAANRTELFYRWTIYYNNDDRSKIALQFMDGRYLYAPQNKYGSWFNLSKEMCWWYVYRGCSPGTFWLSTSQMPDGFMHTWQNNSGEGSVALFTNRDPNASETYNCNYGAFEQWTTGLSWRLRPTPEYQQWKANRNSSQTGQQSDQQGLCCNNCGQKCPAYQQAMKEVEATKAQNAERAAKRNRELEEAQAASTRREEDINKREKEITGREQKTRDSEADLKKREEDLKKREEKARAAEERVQNSEQSGPAEHLASQQENDKLVAENKQLREDLEATKRQIADLQRRAQQQQHRPSGGIKLSMREPSKTLPPKVLPSKVLPKQERPAQNLPNGWNPGLVKKFEAGRTQMRKA